MALSRALIRAAREGDKAAREHLGKWMTSALYEFYSRRGRPLQEIEDLSQDVIADIFRKLDDAPDDPQLFRSRVERFANMAVKQHKTRAFRHERKRWAMQDQPQTPARRPDSRLAIQRLLARVRSEINKLSTPKRRAIMLLLERDDTQKQIAEELGIPAGTLANRLWKLRRDVRAALSRGRRTTKRYRS